VFEVSYKNVLYKFTVIIITGKLVYNARVDSMQCLAFPSHKFTLFTEHCE